MTVTTDSWRTHAACRDADPDLFYGIERELRAVRELRETEARTFCKRCPVAARCLEDALDAGHADGIRGDKLPDELKKLLAGRAAGRAA